MKTVSIIGIGRLGGALAIALSRAGFDIDQLVYRSAEPSNDLLELVRGYKAVVRFDRLGQIRSDIVFITTADTEIRAAAQSVATVIRPGTIVLHTSGALSSEILESIAKTGGRTGSMHPLVSFSDPILGAERFSGAYFCVEGDPMAIAASERIAGALGGTSFSIDTGLKPLYHASAVMASGHLTALIAEAVGVLSRCGVTEGKAKDILLPLVGSTVDNISKQDAHTALTGPFARKDLEAIERHLAAFDGAGLADEKRLYLELGLAALKLAEKAGGADENTDEIRDAIRLAQASAK